MAHTLTISELRNAIEASEDGRVRVTGGEPGTEDYDEGYAYVDEADDAVMVAWDSQVRTPAFDGLELA